MPEFTLKVNGQARQVTVESDTPLIYVLRNDLSLNSPKFGCGLDQCGSCKVLIDGEDRPSCKVPVSEVADAEIVTLEGLGTPDNLHSLQSAFLDEQAVQCGFCTAGMIMAAHGLLNRNESPSDDDIREALTRNLCRCGTYDRVRRAVKSASGQSDSIPNIEVQTLTDGARASSNELPTSLQKTPGLDAWVRINTDETVTIFSGKVELGQGIKTALAQIAAEELDVAVSRIRVVTVDTQESPDEGGTTGSMSVEMSGNAQRVASAEARHLMLALAFEHLESQTPVHELTVNDGVIRDPITGRETTYWALMGGKPFGHEISGIAKPKDPSTHTVVGTSTPRIDLLAKVTGGASYVHDMQLPDMLHGRVVRPPGYHARLVSVETNSVESMPGVVSVVRDGSFLAVIAEREEQAVKAADALREQAQWEYQEMLPAQETLYDNLRADFTQSNLIVDGTGTDGPILAIQAPDDAVQTLTATFFRPYHMHASVGPSAAVAQWSGDQLTVWSHTQSAFNLQGSIAQVLGLDVSQVRVIHTEGAGCYGHNGADDAGMDAALLARAANGRPVSVKWMRSDEHGWEPYSSAMVVDMQASLNSDGEIIDWNHDVYSYPHSTRPRPDGETSGLLAAWHLAEPFPQQQGRALNGSHFGSHRNADPKYAFRRKRVVRHFVPNSPLRVSAMRSLGAYANIFAIESFMDELAFAAGIDPVEFRLRHLADERAKAVIQAAAEKSNWTPRTEPSNTGHGWGIAFAQYKNRQTYCAIVVEVQVDRDSGEIKLGRVVIAGDSGQVVNPDGLSNQLEGGFVQAASWTLLEEVKYDAQGVTSLDWDSYPILRFNAAPPIETVILNRPDMPFMGSGEASQNPTPAAIANAVYDAVGVRLRSIPFTPERVKVALEMA